MTAEIYFRKATVADWPQVAALLTSAHLPLEGAQPHVHDFVVAIRDKALIGCAGLEHYGDAALLRSVAVRESERGTGLGQQLVNALLAHARDRRETYRAAHRNRARLLSTLRLPRHLTRRRARGGESVGRVHERVPRLGDGDGVDVVGARASLALQTTGMKGGENNALADE